MLGSSKKHWEKLYAAWYQKEKKNTLKLRPIIGRHSLVTSEKSTIFIESRHKGSNNCVFDHCVDENGNLFAMKTILDSDIEEDWFNESNISLFSEGCIHFYLYNLYKQNNRENRILEPIKMGLIFRKGKLCVYVAMKRFDYPLYRLLNNCILTQNEINSLSNEIVTELDFLFKTYKFTHCDLHTGNIGFISKNGSGNWFLFDFGMSQMFCHGVKIISYQVEPFFDDNIKFNNNFDKRILFHSWCSFEEKAANIKRYVFDSIKNMKDTHVHEWVYNTPVCIKSNVLANTGRYIESTEKGIYCKVAISNKMVKAHDKNLLKLNNMKGRYEFLGKKDNKNVYIKINVEEDHLEPNFNHPHICYYFHYLE